MLKSVRFFAKPSIQNLLTLPLFAVVVPLYSMLLFTVEYGVAGQRNAVFFLLCCGLICSAVGMALFSTYLQLALTNGTTRKLIFMATIVCKLIFSLLACCIAFVTLLGYYFVFDMGISLSFNVAFFCTILAGAVLCFSIGELLGLLSTRFGKVIYFVFIFAMMIVGGIIGALTAIGGFGGMFSNALAFFTASAAAPIGLMLLISAVIECVNWVLVRRCTVRMS